MTHEVRFFEAISIRSLNISYSFMQAWSRDFLFAQFIKCPTLCWSARRRVLSNLWRCSGDRPLFTFMLIRGRCTDNGGGSISRADFADIAYTQHLSSSSLITRRRNSRYALHLLQRPNFPYVIPRSDVKVHWLCTTGWVPNESPSFWWWWMAR